jgi:hypothetical protein
LARIVERIHDHLAHQRPVARQIDHDLGAADRRIDGAGRGARPAARVGQQQGGDK